MAASSSAEAFISVQTETTIEKNGCGILNIQWNARLQHKSQPWWGFFEFTPDELSQSTDWRLPWDYVSEDQIRSYVTQILVPLSFLLSSAAERFTVRLFHSGSQPYRLCGESRVIRAKEFLDFETQKPSLQLAWKSGQLLISAARLPPTFAVLSTHNCTPLALSIQISEEGAPAYFSQALEPDGVLLAPRRDFRAGVNTIRLVSKFQHINTVLENIEVDVDSSFQVTMHNRGLPSLFDLSLRVVSHQLLPMLFGQPDKEPATAIKPTAAASSTSTSTSAIPPPPTSPPPPVPVKMPNFFADVESQSLDKLAEQGLSKLTSKKFMQLFQSTNLTSLTLPSHRFGSNLLNWAHTLPQLTTLCITEPKAQHIDPSLLSNLRCLQSLSLQQMWTNVTDALWTALAQLTNLRELFLTSTFSQAVEATASFVPATAEVFSRLIAFELSGFNNDVFWQQLLATPNPRLVSLSANMSQFRDNNATVLPERFPNLVRFSANYSMVSPASLASFQALPHLESLALSFSTGFDSHTALGAHMAELRALADRLSTFYCVSAFHGSEELHTLELSCQEQGRAVQLCSVYWKIVVDPADNNRYFPIFKRICSPGISVEHDWVGFYPSRATPDNKWGEWTYLRDAPNIPPAGVQLLPGEVCTRSFVVNFSMTPHPEFRYFKGSTHLQGVCLIKPTHP